MKRKFRFLNKMYAYVMGYFWLPCSECGKMFGGHEYSKKYVFDNNYHKMITREAMKYYERFEVPFNLVCWRHDG